VAGGAAALALLAFGAFVVAANKTLAALSHLHERGFASDISLAAGLGVVLIALLLGFGISITGPLASWQVGLLICLWVGCTFGGYAWVIERAAAAPGPHRSLLILRVFSRSGASERLLDALQTRWRSLGPVYEIAGPDLARLNVDARTLEKFLTSRLHEAFLFDVSDDQSLVNALDSEADREGRYRVNQVFCLESSWRATVGRLMRMSHAIVLDVRGFTQERKGTAFEIELLAHEGLLARTVVLDDGTADWQQFDARITSAGCDPGDVTRVRTGGKDSIDRIVAALVRVDSPAQSRLSSVAI
jgi:hypothetical protein